MHFCIFKVGKNPDKAKKHEQADRKCIQNDRRHHAVSDRQNDQGRINHKITDRTDQHGDGVEFSGFVPQKSDDARRTEQNDTQCQRLYPNNVGNECNAGKKDSRIHERHEIDRHLELHFPESDDELDRRNRKTEDQRNHRTDRKKDVCRNTHYSEHFYQDCYYGHAVKNRIDIVE